MEKDIIRAVPVQCTDDCTLEETTQVTVRLHLAYEETAIGSVTVRVFNPDYHIVAEGVYNVPQRKHTMRRCTVPLTLSWGMQWSDGYYHFVVIKNCGYSLMGRVTLLLDASGGTTTVGNLERFNLYSFEYYYVKETECGLCSSLMYCDFDVEQRRNLLHTLIFLDDVINEHRARYGHAPHFFLTGDPDLSCLQTRCFESYFSSRHPGQLGEHVWNCSLGELMNNLTPYGFKTKSNQIELLVIDLYADGQDCAGEVAALFKRMNSDSFLKHLTVIIYGTEQCYREWEALCPGMLEGAHFVSPLHPYLGESAPLPTAVIADKTADDQAAASEPCADNSELKALVGLQRVKLEVAQACTMARFVRRRQQMGLPAMGDNRHHMLFLGNPGTGKTTVAKMVGRMYHSMGWLSKGHTVEVNRSKLVGEYIGQTEAKTTKAIEDARGGVLFIDEAYALVHPVGMNNDFGREVLNALMTALSQPNPDLIIILAGYEDRMQQMLESNAGLRDRFPLTLHFDDFTADELLQMAQNLATSQGFEFTPEATVHLQAVIDRAVRTRDRHFGNGRWLHNLMEHGILKSMAERVMHTPTALCPDERLLLTRIEEVDVQAADELWLSQRSAFRPTHCRVGF